MEKRKTYADGVGRELIGVMTLKQARRYAEKTMPADLRRAGFNAGVFVSDAYINGDLFYRIGYGKRA